MPKRLRDITYNMPQSTMGMFNPVEYNPQAPDINLLVNRIDKVDTAFEKISEQKNAIKQAAAQVRMKLPQNKEMLDYFDEKINKTVNDIDSEAESGNVLGAVNVAREGVGNILSDNIINTALKNEEDYQNWKKTLDSRNDLNSRTKRYYNKLYGYSPTITRDENGNATDISTFDSSRIAESSIDWDKEFALVKQLISYKDGKIEYKLSDGTIVSKRTTELGEKDIADFMLDRIEHNQGLRDALAQEYAIDKAYVEDLKKQRENYTKGSPEYNDLTEQINREDGIIMAENGGELSTKDYATYYANKVNNANNAYAPRIGYKHEFYDKTYPNSGTAGGSQTGGVGSFLPTLSNFTFSFPYKGASVVINNPLKKSLSNMFDLGDNFVSGLEEQQQNDIFDTGFYTGGTKNGGYIQ